MQEPGAASTSGPEGAITLVSPAWLRHGPKGMFGGRHRFGRERMASLDARCSRPHRDQFYRQGFRQRQGVEELPKYLEDGMIGSGDPQS